MQDTVNTKRWKEVGVTKGLKINIGKVGEQKKDRERLKLVEVKRQKKADFLK